MSAKTLLWLLLASVSYGGLVQSRESAAPNVVVYKMANCHCCKQWVKHLQNAGFSVNTRDIRDLKPIRQRVGVPAGLEACHTAEVGGYFVEGHVPAEDIKRLLRERPAAKGLAVPGMPAGSPGMDAPPGKGKPYDVFLVARDGSSKVFARHGH